MLNRYVVLFLVSASLVAGYASAESTGESSNETDAIFEPKLNANGRMMFRLPSDATDVIAAGGGRYLVLYLKKLKSLAVFDICQAKVLKFIDLPNGDVCFAAGLDKLFMASSENNSISRYDLATCNKELTVLAPEQGVQAMQMGFSSDGPLVVASGKRTLLYDPIAMTSQRFQWEHWAKGDDNWPAPAMRVSGDGHTIVAWGGGWAGVELAVVNDQKVLDHRSGVNTEGAVRVSYDGRMIFTPGNAFTSDLDAAGVEINGYGFASQSPNYFLAINPHQSGRKGQAALKIYLTTGPKLVWTLNDAAEMARSTLPPEQRIFFVPKANVIAFIGAGNDNIQLRRFNVIDALKQADIDYLLVTSVAPEKVAAGKKYIYQLEATSKRGGLAYSLSDGPEGMTLSPEGKIVWDVPKEFKSDSANVIVSVKDDSGQEIFHAFKIHINKPKPLPPPPPPRRLVPRDDGSIKA